MKKNWLDDLISGTSDEVVADQRDEKWHRARLGRFTASEMWRLVSGKKDDDLSDTALAYVHEKVAECLSGQSKDQHYAAPLQWGIDYEDEARKTFSERCGKSFVAPGFFKYGDHAGGSPDGIFETEAEKEILEVKCPFESKNHIAFLTMTDLKTENKNYYWQCQANLLFTSADSCSFVSFDPRMPDSLKLSHTIVKRNEEDIALIILKIKLASIEKMKILNYLESKKNEANRK